MKHDWTAKESKICCKLYKECFCRNICVDKDTVVDILYKKLNKQITKESIELKLKNIKALALEYNIKDKCPLPPLTKYAKLDKKNFKKVFFFKIMINRFSKFFK